MSKTIRCIDCGYVLWGLPDQVCPECGRAFDPNNPATYSTKPPFVAWKYWLPGFLLAVGIGTALILVSLFVAGWSWAASLAVPVCIGAFVGYGCRARTWLLVFLVITAILCIGAALLTLSVTGIFCTLVFCIIALVPALVGVVFGLILRNALKNSQFGQRWHLPLVSLCAAIVCLSFVDRLTHRPYAVESIVTSVELPVAVDRAWDSLMFYEEVHRRPPWLLRLGLPRPLYTRGSILHVGDSKTCVYSKGHLTKRVTQRIENRRLAFEVTEQDHFENHSIRLTTGSFDLTPTSPTSTRVDLTTSYQPKLGPRWVWRPAELLATHTLHHHVLEGMKDKAAGEP